MFSLITSTKYLAEGFAGMSKAFHLMERSDGGYVQVDSFLFIYSKRNLHGAQIVVLKDLPKYHVLLLKNNKGVNSNFITYLKAQAPGLSDIKVFDAIEKLSSDREYLKKTLKNLDGKAVSNLLLQKEGMLPGVFDKAFPELKSSLSDDGQPISGLNVIGIDQFKKTAPMVKAIEKAVAMVKDAGFGHLCYGDVFLLGSAVKSSVGADYSPTTDQIRFKIKSADEERLMHELIHEMGHRQWHKFKLDQSAVGLKYQEARKNQPILKIGTVFKMPKDDRIFVINDLKYGRGGISYSASLKDNPEKKFSVAKTVIDHAEVIEGEKPDIHPFRVSSYAMTLPGEFWAEVFATSIMKKEPHLVKWVNEVTS